MKGRDDESRLRRLLSINGLLGWVIFTCMVIPFAKGCKNEVMVPVEAFAGEEFATNYTYSAVFPTEASIFNTWPVAIGAVWGCLCLYLVRSRRTMRYFHGWVVLSMVLVLLALGSWASIDVSKFERDGDTQQPLTSKQRAEIFAQYALLVPTVVFPALAMGAVLFSYFQGKTWPVAFGMVQLMLSGWIIVWLVLPEIVWGIFFRMLLVGGFITYIAYAVILFCSTRFLFRAGKLERV